MSGFLPLTFVIIFNTFRPSRQDLDYVIGGTYYIVALPRFSEVLNPEVVAYIGLWNDEPAAMELTVEDSWTTLVEVNGRITQRVVIGYKWSLTERFGRVMFVTESTGSSALFSLVVSFYGQDTAPEILHVMEPLFGFTYYVATLGPNPLIIVSTSRNFVLVKITFKFSPADKNYRYSHQGEIFLSGDETEVECSAHEHIIIGKCPLDEQQIDFTGTKITGGSAFSVLGGSCGALTEVDPCGAPSYHLMRVIADNALPLEMFGMGFVFVQVPGRNVTAVTKAVAGYPNTTVTVKRQSGIRASYPLARAGDYVEIDTGNTKPFWVASDKPIQVLYLLKAACLTTENVREPLPGRVYASISLIVPNALFYFFYVIVCPDELYWSAVAVVLEELTSGSIRLNGAPLKIQVETVDGNALWQVIHVKLRDSFNNIFRTTYSPFGCYVYGFLGKYSYFRAVEYAKMPPDPPPQERDDHYIVNINSENKKIYKGKVNGNWNEWANAEILCNDTCAVRQKYLFRACKNPPSLHGGQKCQGDAKRYLHDSCPNHYCLEDCPEFTFGPQCESCRNCEPACDNVTGTCTSCRVGFKNPRIRCLSMCAPNEYGKDCAGDCMKKCGEICEDPLTGRCRNESLSTTAQRLKTTMTTAATQTKKDSRSGWSFKWLLLLFIAISLALLVIYLRSQKGKVPDDQDKQPEMIYSDFEPEADSTSEEQRRQSYDSALSKYGTHV